MLAYCGLGCDTCPIHLATLEQDKSKQLIMRVAIAKIFSDHYGMNLQPKDINDCDGCRSETGRLFSGCRSCEIRNCAVERKLDSCAFCGEYACDKLRKFFESEPDAQKRLEALRSAG